MNFLVSLKVSYLMYNNYCYYYTIENYIDGGEFYALTSDEVKSMVPLGIAKKILRYIQPPAVSISLGQLLHIGEIYRWLLFQKIFQFLPVHLLYQRVHL